MKRKGFTLVELLAVIIVLGVIALISTPIVINQIETTRQESYKASVRNVFDAVSEYYANNLETNDLPSGGILIPDSVVYQKLVLKNADFTSGRIFRGENGILMVENITNGKYCASGSKNELKVAKGNCSLLDDTPPYVKLSVSRKTTNSITVVVNAIDSQSKISGYKYYLSNSASGSTTDGKLMESSEDNVYTFTGLKADTYYTMYVVATNGVGIDSEKVSITENTAARDITYKVSPSSDIWSHSKTVTINYPKSVGTEVRKYKIAGQTDWIVVNDSTVEFVVDKITTVTAGIFDSNNKIVLSQDITVGSVDNTPPTIIGINGNTDVWETSKKIIISADDGAGIGIAKEKAYSFDGGKTWQDDVDKVFYKAGYIYVKVKDELGNVSDAKEFYLQYIDSTIPTAKVTATIGTATGSAYKSGKWTNQSIVLHANPNPPVNKLPCKEYLYQWYVKDGSGDYKALSGATGETLTLTGGTAKLLDKTYKVEVKTIAGSPAVMSTNSINVKIDKIAPTCSWSGENTEWDTEDRTITLKCSDSNSKCVETSKKWTYDYSIKTDNIKYTMKDKAGNSVSCERENENATSIYVDKTAPTVTVTKVTTSTRAVGVVFNAADEHSGIDTSKYPYECMLLTPTAMSGSGSGTYAGTITTSGTTSGTAVSTTTGNSCKYTNLKNNSTYYYKIVVKDAVGNPTIVTNSFRTDDFGNISVSWTDSEKWTTNKDVTITADQTKDKVTGNKMKLQYQLQDVYIENNTYKCKPVDATASAWTDIDSGYKFNIAKKVCVYTRLNDGYNTTSAKTDMITKVDITPPTIKALIVSSTTNSITVSPTITDDESGLDKNTIEYGISTSENGTYIWGTGRQITKLGDDNIKDNTQYYVKTRISDMVGNSSTSSAKAINTKVINAPTWGVDTSGWAKSKAVKVTYDSTNISSPVYFLKSTVGGTTNVQLVTCSTASSSTPTNASECTGTAISASGTISKNTWYMVKSGTTATITIKENGTLYARTSDGNNVSTQSTREIKKIDNTAPILSGINSGSGGNWSKTRFNVSFYTYDEGSGLNSNSCQYKYAYDTYGTCNNTWCDIDMSKSGNSYSTISTTTGIFTTPFSAERNTTVYFRCSDNVGNVSNIVTTPIKIDGTPPTISYSSPGGTYTTTSKTIAVTVNDNLAYGKTQIHLYGPGDTSPRWQLDSSQHNPAYIELNGVGTWTIYTKGYDAAGNKHTQEPSNTYGWYHQTYTLQAPASSGTTTPTTSSRACSWWMSANDEAEVYITKLSGFTSGQSVIISGGIISGATFTEVKNQKANAIQMVFTPGSCDSSGGDCKYNNTCSFTSVTGKIDSCTTPSGGDCSSVLNLTKNGNKFVLSGKYGISCNWNIEVTFNSTMKNSQDNTSVNKAITYRINDTGLFDKYATSSKYDFGVDICYDIPS